MSPESNASPKFSPQSPHSHPKQGDWADTKIMGLGLTFGNKNNISGRLKAEVKSQEVSDLDIALVDMNISNTSLVTVDMKLVDTFSILFIIYSITSRAVSSQLTKTITK